MDYATLLMTLMSATISGIVFGYTWYFKKVHDIKDRTSHYEIRKAYPRILWGVVLSIGITFCSELFGLDLNVLAAGPLGQFLYFNIEQLFKGLK